MKQRRAVGRVHQPETCLNAPGTAGGHDAALHPRRETLGSPSSCTRTRTHTVAISGMPNVGWSALGSASLAERTFGKRLDGTGIPAYGTCRPKEPST